VADRWPLRQPGNSQIQRRRIHFYKIDASCVLRIWPRVVEGFPGGDKCLCFKRRAAVMSSALNLNGESIGQVDIRPPLAVAPEASVREVLRLLKERRRGSVLVCRQGRLVGILTERDILRLLAGRPDLDVAVEREMTPDPLTANLSDSVGAAVERMAENGYRRLPLVDAENRPIGEIDVEGIVHLLVQHFPQAVYNLPPVAGPPTGEREGP
jgi:CBS domain-containing protein